MPISYVGKIKVTVARFMRGKCGICHEMIMPGEAYFTCVGGTNISSGYLAHYNCYKPASALIWEALTPNQQAILKGKGE